MGRGRIKSCFIFILFQLLLVQSLLAQQFMFIEADGQQPFYVKRGGETFSSTAAGFILIPKLTQSEIDIVIGFPNNIYPEVAFKIKQPAIDRGFHLKQFDGQGWVLVDRSSQEQIKGGTVDVKKPVAVTTSTSSGFAEMLVEATGDKSLLDKSTILNTVSTKLQSADPKPKPVVVAAKNQSQVKTQNKPLGLGVVRSVTQSDDSAYLRILFFEKTAKDKWDTIQVEIEKWIDAKPPAVNYVTVDKSENISSATAVVEVQDEKAGPQSGVSSLISDCLHPVAMPKDVKDIQKKLSKAAIFEDQLKIIDKVFQEKCFSTKQVKVLGDSFWDEQSRLNFYAYVRKWVIDAALFGELEQSFLQEGSRIAFREMLKKQVQ